MFPKTVKTFNLVSWMRVMRRFTLSINGFQIENLNSKGTLDLIKGPEGGNSRLKNGNVSTKSSIMLFIFL